MKETLSVYRKWLNVEFTFFLFDAFAVAVQIPFILAGK